MTVSAADDLAFRLVALMQRRADDVGRDVRVLMALALIAGDPDGVRRWIEAREAERIGGSPV